MYLVFEARSGRVQEGDWSIDSRLNELQVVIATKWLPIACKVIVATQLHRRHLFHVPDENYMSEILCCDYKLMVVRHGYVKMTIPLVAPSLKSSQRNALLRTDADFQNQPP